MQDQVAVRKAYRARFSQLRKATRNMLLLLERDADYLTGEEIGQLRSYAEDAVQFAHEYSAYWNVVHTGDK